MSWCTRGGGTPPPPGGQEVSWRSRPIVPGSTHADAYLARLAANGAWSIETWWPQSWSSSPTVSAAYGRTVRTSAEALAGDRDALDLVAFNLMLAVQTCLDLASHLIADEGWEAATSLAESFARLHAYGVITSRSTEALGEAAKFRNVVAHGYAIVDPQRVFLAATHRAARPRTLRRRDQRLGQ